MGIAARRNYFRALIRSFSQRNPRWREETNLHRFRTQTVKNLRLRA